MSWATTDFTGSNLTDIATRNHADLQNINTATYTHLSSTNHTDLTDAGDSALHYHSADRVSQNVISSPTTIAVDTSYVVVSYLTVNDTFTLNGNLMVIG